LSKLSFLRTWSVVFFFILVFIIKADAGTTKIHVDTEEGGNIDSGTKAQWDGLFANAKGAMFWNGSQWVTNDTAAHMYFTDLDTGQRLKEYNVTTVDPGIAVLGQILTRDGWFTVTKQLYRYTKGAASGGLSYSYQAVEYVIVPLPPMEDPPLPSHLSNPVILRSRGTGSGTAQAYFDIYIEDAAGNTNGILGDPVWYFFENLTAAQAVNQRPDINSAHVKGNLPTCSPSLNARYWMDINGGSDMGGLTYHFTTQCLDPATVKTAGFSPSFISTFSLMYMDSNNQLQKIVFTPALASETINDAQQNVPVPTMTEWGMIIFMAMAGLTAVYYLGRQGKA
jgi:hypothetical protein